MNQTPLIRGVNSNPFVLSKLFNKLTYIGIPPYYVFQCRPTLGNETYAVPIEKGYEIFEQARMNCSGLAKSARFVMSHETGKIQITAKTDNRMYFKYLQAADPKKLSCFLVFRSNPDAYWFDDYDAALRDHCLENPFIGGTRSVDKQRKLSKKTKFQRLRDRIVFPE